MQSQNFKYNIRAKRPRKVESLCKPSNIQNLVNKSCRCPPSRWNFVSASESTRCTYIFSVRRWQRRSTVMIVAFATNCRSPPLLGRPGERCLCFALQCSAWCGNYCCYKYFCHYISATILLLLLQILFLLFKRCCYRYVTPQRDVITLPLIMFCHSVS